VSKPRPNVADSAMLTPRLHFDFELRIESVRIDSPRVDVVL
jgi:hypothetical protein